MRRMSTRQVILHMTYVALLAGLSGCLPSNGLQSVPTQTVISSTATATVTLPPSPVPATPTPTPLTCLTQPGLVEQDVVPTTNPPQQFIVYLKSGLYQGKVNRPAQKLA
jgi:hypothetical protein